MLGSGFCHLEPRPSSPEAVGQLPAVDFGVRPERSGGQIELRAAGHRQVADKMGSGVDAAKPQTQELPTGAGASCKGRDRWRRRSQAQPLPGAALAEPGWRETFFPASGAGSCAVG